MADLVLANFVKETTTTTGTGTYSLAGAATGHQGFVAGVGGGSKVPYFVTDGTNWEHGLGTVTDAATDTISRDKIYASSNAGAAVNWSAGTRDIYLAESAHRPNSIHTITGNTTLSVIHKQVLCNSASAITVTLPPAADLHGMEYTITNINTGKVTVDGNSTETIRDPVFGSAETLDLWVQYDSVRIVSDGSAWWVIAKNFAPHHAEVELQAATSISSGANVQINYDAIITQRGASADLAQSNEILINRTGRYKVYGRFYIQADSGEALRYQCLDDASLTLAFCRLTSSLAGANMNALLDNVVTIAAGKRLGGSVFHTNSPSVSTNATAGLRTMLGVIEIL
jgi:hypothetical protein